MSLIVKQVSSQNEYLKAKLNFITALEVGESLCNKFIMNVTGETVETWTMLSAKLTTWVQGAILALPNLMVATLVMVGFWLIARAAAQLASRILVHTSESPTVNRLIVATTRTIILVFGLFTTLGILNLDKTVASLLAGAGVIGLAIGFAFQEIAANFFSGILIAIRKPYQEGDLIKVDDHFGVVSEITLRTTNLRTFDGLLILIPNKDMFTKPVINYTSTPDRRVDISLGFSYTTDLKLAEKVARAAVENLEGRIADRAVGFLYREFGESSINCLVQIWIHFHSQADYANALHAALIALKEAFDREGISLPFPTRTIEILRAPI